MTAKEFLICALALLGEGSEDAADYEDHVIPLINTILSETFNAENSIRMAQKQDILTSTPFLHSLSDSVPYNADLICRCMQYGLAMKLALEDDDFAKANYLSGMYVQGMNECMKATLGVIADVYGDLL